MIYPDSETRTVFLGGQALGTSTMFSAYGADPLRDQAGVIERIADQEWRLVTPSPRTGYALEVIHITP